MSKTVGLTVAAVAVGCHETGAKRSRCAGKEYWTLMLPYLATDNTVPGSAIQPGASVAYGTESRSVTLSGWVGECIHPLVSELPGGGAGRRRVANPAPCGVCFEASGCSLFRV